jgi:inositol hexakisphosphate/diphosphoinositol-pentakisphosphate kinase
MVQRWETINKDFYKKKDNCYDLTKVPDLHDMTRYDYIHNSHLGLTSLEELRVLCKLFADCVVPQEYGVDEADKRQLGSKMCNGEK